MLCFRVAGAQPFPRAPMGWRQRRRKESFLTGSSLLGRSICCSDHLLTFGEDYRFPFQETNLSKSGIMFQKDLDFNNYGLDAVDY